MIQTYTKTPGFAQTGKNPPLSLSGLLLQCTLLLMTARLLHSVTKFDVSLQVVDARRYISLSMAVTAAVMLFIMSCAKISSPSGGPRDTEPPVILKSEPENSTVMFTGRSFMLTFDEYVVLDRITEKFMVSPPLSPKPEVKLRGKSLQVTWEGELIDSTTYTFYFQDAIRDNNEGNPIPNYQYVFSTGPVLDSLSLTGNVFGALDLEAVQDVTVMMYSNLSDTAPHKQLPAYISRPEPSGGFMISNIRPGRYRLYALQDMNGNTMYDLDDELFAFCDSVIDINPDDYYALELDSVKYRPPAATETIKPDVFLYGIHRLYASSKSPDKQYLLYSDRKSAWSLGFALALPTDTGQISLALTDAPPESWFMESNVARDTFTVWITSREVYDRDAIEALLTYPYTDSAGVTAGRTDTINLRYYKPAAPRGGERKAPALALTSSLTGKLRPGTQPLFVSPTPLSEPDTSKIVLQQTADSVTTVIPYRFQPDSTNSRRLLMKAPLESGGSYTLICRAGAFKDIYGTTTDSIGYRFSVATEEDYGSVKVVLTGYEGKVIIQLLDIQEKVVRETRATSPGEVPFSLLDKGRYRIKAIYDLDSNRVWSPGNFDLGISPEPVTYYPAELDVKINWALEQDWDLGKVYQKDVSLRKKPAAKR